MVEIERLRPIHSKSKVHDHIDVPVLLERDFSGIHEVDGQL